MAAAAADTFGGGYFGTVKRPSTHPANGGTGMESFLKGY